MHPVLIIGTPEKQASGAVRPLAVRWLGTVPYAEGVLLQEDLVRARQQGKAPDTLLLLEHPPVVTLGRSADPAHLRFPEDELRRQGVEIFEAGRGGDVTFHGPGQLVGYPILLLPPPLRDLHGMLRRVETALIAVAADFGIEARREEGLTGVWVGRAKLAAIGMRVSRWVTSHGFALNVAEDLKGFDLIVPCGIRDRGVTSLSRLLGRPVSPQEVIPSVASHFGRAFGLAAAEVQHVGG
ncbi:MAG TPA: lipoyl(octanoyl) transferase LipB [Candidatus Polarisedimenticolia bacterium]|nr:lipoyl(octanoyl) transferase LipB [Candidatus Polarisedimenticolia bacterium]